MFLCNSKSYLDDCQMVWTKFDKWTRHLGLPPAANLDNVNRFLKHQALHPDGVVQKCKGLQVSLSPF